MNFLILIICWIYYFPCYGSSNNEADILIESIGKTKNFSGVVGVFNSTKILYQKTIGVRAPSSKIPIENEDIFRIGSITKEFTAYLIVDAVKRKELSLDSKVSDFLPAKGVLAKTKIRQILNHTAGLSNQTIYSEYAKHPCSMTSSKENLDVWLKTITVNESMIGQFIYSNAGYEVLACILEAKTKLRYDSLLKSRIFDPLKMISSGVAWSFPEQPRVVHARSKDENEVLFDTSLYFGAGDIISNISDLINWQKHLNNSDIYHMMLSNTVKGRGKWNYGFGVIVDTLDSEPFYWVSGNTPGFTSELSWFPSKSLGVIILSNRQDFPVREEGKMALTVQLTNIFLEKKPQPADLLKSLGI
jgi:CubicO group peptidase (beta-lactamase class C family)